MEFLKDKKARRKLILPPVFSACRNLIIIWFIIFLLIAVLTGIIIKEAPLWAKVVITVACMAKIIFTAKVVPEIGKSLKSEELKEKKSKKMTLKIMGLVVTNLINPIFFIIWTWSAAGETAKVSFGILLLLESGLIWLLFLVQYRDLKKHVTGMHIECELVGDAEIVYADVQEKKFEEKPTGIDTKDFAKLEHKGTKE